MRNIKARPDYPFRFTNTAVTPVTEVTYGRSLYLQPYSVLLRELIYECLREVPANRPTLAGLKSRIKQGIAITEEEGGIDDNWYDIEVPDPETV